MVAVFSTFHREPVQCSEVLLFKLLELCGKDTLLRCLVTLTAMKVLSDANYHTQIVSAAPLQQSSEKTTHVVWLTILTGKS